LHIFADAMHIHPQVLRGNWILVRKDLQLMHTEGKVLRLVNFDRVRPIGAGGGRRRRPRPAAFRPDLKVPVLAQCGK
jgi:hypothetical protein